MTKRNKLFQALCVVLKNRGRNQFRAAAEYADALFCNEIDESADYYELPEIDSKSGRPIVIEL